MHCGNEPVVPSDATTNDVASDGIGGDADLIVDAQPDRWSGCPDVPVVCPDADFFVKINGDGPEQVLRSTKWWDWMNNQSSSPNDAGYAVPLARVYHYPDNMPPIGDVWASDTPDGGTVFEIATTGSSIEVWYTTGGTKFVSVYADAQPDAVYSQNDPPGGIVSGTFSAAVGSPSEAGTRQIWGSFVACRICDYSF
jgi:hypothetical protein